LQSQSKFFFNNKLTLHRKISKIRLSTLLLPLILLIFINKFYYKESYSQTKNAYTYNFQSLAITGQKPTVKFYFTKVRNTKTNKSNLTLLKRILADFSFDGNPFPESLNYKDCNQPIRTPDFSNDFSNDFLKQVQNKIDTSEVKPVIKSDTAIFTMRKNPWKAVALSAIIPGLGQFYNQSYWKIPIIAGLGGYFGYEIISNNNKFNDYKDRYADSQTTTNPDGDPVLRNYREFYRDQRDQFILYFIFLYVINIVDAYVDAHLFDFSVSDSYLHTSQKSGRDMLISKQTGTPIKRGSILNIKINF